MTRGKYAARAALRREDESVRSEIEAYKRNVKRLTAENEELRAALAAERDGRKQEVGRLRAQRDEGLSPELIALREELGKQRMRADAAVARAGEAREAQGALVHFTAKLLHNFTGCTGLEAVERIVRAVKGVESLSIADAKTGAVKPQKQEGGQVATLQRVRGWRSSPQVIERLDAAVAAAQGRGE